MANLIQTKRGAEANLPILSLAELAFTTDTQKAFIGSGADNIELAQRLGIIKTSENLYGGVLGSLPYQLSAGITDMLTPNVSASKMFLSETGTGVSGGIPAWSQITYDDILGETNSYIKNQFTSGQVANLWINGTAKTGKSEPDALSLIQSTPIMDTYSNRVIADSGVVEGYNCAVTILNALNGGRSIYTSGGTDGVTSWESDTELVSAKSIKSLFDSCFSLMDNIYLRLDTANSPLTNGLTINGGTGDLSTGLSFGDGDTGLFELSDDNLYIAIGGTTKYGISAGSFSPYLAQIIDLGAELNEWENIYVKTVRANNGIFASTVSGADAALANEFVTLGQLDAVNGNIIDKWIDLTDTPISYAGKATNLVKVNSAETGLEFTPTIWEQVGEFISPVISTSKVQIDTLSLWDNGSLSRVFFTEGGVYNDVDWTNDSQLVSAKAIKSLFDSVDISQAFLDLTDTPSSYSGYDDYLVRVISEGQGLEFIAPVWKRTTNVITPWETTPASVLIGDYAHSDYAEFDTDGSLYFHGTATMFDDQQVNLGEVQGSGWLGNPAVDVVQYRSGTALEFKDSTTNSYVAVFNTQLSHKYREGSDIEFHIHIGNNSSNSGNAVFRLTYEWGNINGTFPSSTSVTKTITIDGVNGKHQAEEIVTSISGTGKEISSILLCTLERLSGDANDTLKESVYIIGLDFHIEVNSIGSDEGFIK